MGRPVSPHRWRLRLLIASQAATVNQLQGALKSNQAQIQSAKLNLIYSRITSPISGRVGPRLVDPGTWCTPRIRKGSS